MLWRVSKGSIPTVRAGLTRLERWEPKDVAEPAPSVRSSEEYLACSTAEAPTGALFFFLMWSRATSLASTHDQHDGTVVSRGILWQSRTSRRDTRQAGQEAPAYGVRSCHDLQPG